jgi:hypothetical protein
MKNHMGVAVIGLHVCFLGGFLPVPCCFYFYNAFLYIPSEFMNSDNFHSWSVTSYHTVVCRKEERSRQRQRDKTTWNADPKPQPTSEEVLE